MSKSLNFKGQIVRTHAQILTLCVYGLDQRKMAFSHGFTNRSLLTSCIHGHNRIVESTLGTPLVGHSFGKTNDYVVCSGPYREKRVV